MRHSRQNTAQRLMCGAAAIAILSFAATAQAEERPFAIEPQSLSTALAEFGAQSGHAVMAPMNLLDAKTTRGFSRSAEPEIALAQLLDGTGLTYRKTGDTFAIVSASDPQSGSAAGDGADAGTVQALVVTAQKREENIQDVPIAMSAFTQEDLTKSQIAGGPDLMTQIPNFTFTKTNFTSYSIQIRGIGTQAISATTDPAVAVAFNNTPFLRSHFFEQEFYDLARVEVLRGPQGTLYGRNATAGVVNVISAKPSFHFEAKASADVGNYSSTRLEGMLNLPLVEDKAALRIAGAWTKRDGYDINQLTGHPIDGRDLWSTRVSLRIDPTERLRTNFIWEHFKEDDDRLRSGKQLCKRADAPTEVLGVPVDIGGNDVNFPERYLNQACVPGSLYAPEAFQVPDGKTLGYYLPFVELGAPLTGGSNSRWDVYASTTQSRDLRVIESQIDPTYRSNSDTLEFNIDYDIGSDLTLSLQTGFQRDSLWSVEDYNRFNTSPDAFAYCDPTKAYCRENASGQLIPDFSRYIYVAAVDGAVQGSPCDPSVADTRSCEPVGVFCDPQIGCSDRLVVLDLSEERSRQFAQEVRIASDFDGPFNFSVGINYLKYKTNENYYVFLNTVTLMAASPGLSHGTPSPWSPGVSDNHECMFGNGRGFEYVDPYANHNPQFDTCAYIDPNPLGSLNNQGHNYFLSQNPYKLTSYAIFGEAYYKFSSELKVTLGLRWTDDQKHFVDIPSELLLPGYGYPVTGVVDQHWSEPTGRLVVDWTPRLDFADQTLVYASYTHGYKAGGANPPGAVLLTNRIGDVSVPAHPSTFEPEFVNAYEIGNKNTLDGGRITLNTTGFYYDYKGYQISEIIDRSAVNLNFDSTVWGVEVESDWNPRENLRFGVKVGYENTRLADGAKSLDLMDRTAGNPDWMVVKPFVTQASNCILPKYVVAQALRMGDALRISSICGAAYSSQTNVFLNTTHNDPITNQPYVPDPLPGYRGFDPTTAPNNGAGFDKDLSGNSLPNAPHWTGTLTADYTIPLPNDWLATLHSDFYYQSEAWTRVFNMPGYDKLKAYNNVNVAAIFTNESAGWTVMAYVKNVLNKDNITGAFLNSDDTGLTTNVFLNEPRLYGLRVTKNWTGSPWWSAHAHTPGTSFPYWLEVEGYHGPVSRMHEPLAPPATELYAGDFPFPFKAQNDLGWGSGGGVKFTYRPEGAGWTFALSGRYGRAVGATQLHTRQRLPLWCQESIGLCFDPGTGVITVNGQYDRSGRDAANKYNYTDQLVRNEEDHSVADFTVGKDIGLGAAGVRLGLRYARLRSTSNAVLHGRPDLYGNTESVFKYPRTAHQFSAELDARREFQGAGPILQWDFDQKLRGSEQESGRIGLEGGVGAGVLFGKQTARANGSEAGMYRDVSSQFKYDITPPYEHPLSFSRTKSVSVPVANASVGLSYALGGLKVSGGYRIERYFKAIDGGIAERKTYDRDIKGAYIKIGVGFGG
ncbi:MAG: TonB-dependent receptor domain-containing protein [Parcubacteria group bacterium]